VYSTTLRLLAGLLLLALVSGRAAASDAVELESCKVGLADGRCGTVSVLERRDRPQGRRIELFVALVPATSEQREPDPIVILEGGPGASVTHFAGLHVQTFLLANRTRDLLLVDQRGTGKSSPLDCDVMNGFRDLPTAERVRVCRQSLEGSADLAYYTTSDAVIDLIEVLDTLGYEQVNLFAVSNGTRTAQLVLRDHPERIRSVSMLAAYPTSHNVLVESGATLDASLASLMADCAGDADCAAGFPQAERTAMDLADQLGSDPRWPVFSAGVRMMLFFPLQASRLPLLLELVRRSQQVPEPTAGPQDSLFAEWISQGAFLSILCSEDASRTSVEEVRRHSEGTFLGPGWAASLVTSCAEWPRRPLGDDFAELHPNEVPALILVGRLDPAMPPSWAAELAATMPAARVVEIAEGQHSFIGMSGVECVLGLLREFFDSASATRLDTSCVDSMRRPPFAPPPRAANEPTRP
jgi:pimeloyl-ACP methyl ester carboxylesterase